MTFLTSKLICAGIQR